jgi:hypothetical protein
MTYNTVSRFSGSDPDTGSDNNKKITFNLEKLLSKGVINNRNILFLTIYNRNI